MFAKIRIVLVNPSHPGNIGAAARALKNMGFSRLYLVNPVKFPHPEAVYRAAHADDVIKQAVVTKTLGEALKGCHHVFGTSARSRDMSSPVLNVREMAGKIVDDCENTEIAIVFGCERSGLNDEEIRLCQYQIQIPTVAGYSSLNLAAAVQVIVYELRMAILAENKPTTKNKKVDLATADEMEGFYKYLEKTLIEKKFLNPTKPRMMMPRFRQIFNRSHLEKEDVNLIRGMLRAVTKKD